MKKTRLLLMLLLVLTTPALAADPAAAPAAPGAQGLRPRDINPKIMPIKDLERAESLPIIGVCLVRSTSDGAWTYIVPVRNNALVPAPAGTLEVVVFRKTGEEWLLVDTRTIDAEIPAAPKAGSASAAVVATGVFPRCCKTYELMAKLRVKGTQNILDTKVFHTGSLRVLQTADLIIDRDSKQFSVTVKNPTSETYPVILKAQSYRGETVKLLSEQNGIVPPGERSFSGSCQGIKYLDTLVVKVLAPTTCVEPEEDCQITQTSQRY